MASKEVRTNNYGNNSIDTIDEERDIVRQKPHNYFGTRDVHGCAHGTFELVTNSLDEIREGYGDTIDITITEDRVITVKDNGRGVPMGWNEVKKKFNWWLVYCKLYASGKYNSQNYGSSAGQNGVGAAITQFTSDFMDVTSVRDDACEWEKDENGKYIVDEKGARIPVKFKRVRWKAHFEHGYVVGEPTCEDVPEDTPTGTCITYKASEEVFTNTDVPIEVYIDRLRRCAMLVPSAHISLRYKNKERIELYYEKGMTTFIEHICESKLTKNIIVCKGDVYGADDKEETNEEKFYDANFEVHFTFSQEINTIEGYHNGTFLVDGGTHVDSFKSAVVKVIETIARETSKINRNERISSKDVEELIVAVVSSECPGYLTQFVHQTKTSIGNELIGRLAYSVVQEQFTQWALQHKEEMSKIIDRVLINKKAREKANEVKKSVIKKLSADPNTITGAIKKLKPCSSKVPKEQCEIYIVEGDSAGGSCYNSRDGEYQAVLPLRGKIANCMKKTLEQALSSDIIKEFIQALGCGIEARSKYIKDLPKFDISKLNYGKIIICTDADVDGYHIRTLVLTAIYVLMPTLIKEGKVYIVESPLYEICVKGKSETTQFAYSDSHKEEVIKNFEINGIKRERLEINRSKGLGENNVEMMAKSTMDPRTRRLIQIAYNEGDCELLIQQLMGDDIEARRAIIESEFDMELNVS